MARGEEEEGEGEGGGGGGGGDCHPLTTSPLNEGAVIKKRYPNWDHN